MQPKKPCLAKGERCSSFENTVFKSSSGTPKATSTLQSFKTFRWIKQCKHFLLFAEIFLLPLRSTNHKTAGVPTDLVLNFIDLYVITNLSRLDRYKKKVLFPFCHKKSMKSKRIMRVFLSTVNNR